MAGLVKMWKLLAVPVLACVLPGGVFAEFSQTRDFAISVNGKESGFSRMALAQKGDGSFTVAVQASVELQIIFKYRFQMDANELWKDGRLVELKSAVNDNGKQDQVMAAAQTEQISVRKNGGRERTVQSDAWTTSFWKLPDARYHNKNIPVLESYTAESYIGLLQYVGTEPINVGAQQVSCYHFRVTGGPHPIDLWFDQYYLLVREEFVKQGQRMAIQLIGIR
jgi:hypothetical protein